MFGLFNPSQIWGFNSDSDKMAGMFISIDLDRYGPARNSTFAGHDIDTRLDHATMFVGSATRIRISGYHHPSNLV